MTSRESGIDGPSGCDGGILVGRSLPFSGRWREQRRCRVGHLRHPAHPVHPSPAVSPPGLIAMPTGAMRLGTTKRQDDRMDRINRMTEMIRAAALALAPAA